MPIMETLQDTIERLMVSQQLAWEIQDNEKKEWDDEYIYIFIGLFIAYIAINYLITYKKDKK